MAMRPAQPGDILLVVHEFTARSPDELSLAKGDRIQLIERDDDFGDGWFLGKHIQNGNTGLFPEVYTTLAPRAAITSINPQNNANSRSAAVRAAPPPGDGSIGMDFNSMPGPTASYNTGRTAQTPPNPLLNSGYAPPITSFQNTQAPVNQMLGSFQNRGSTPVYTRQAGHNSAVIDETMNVIDEHITSMHKPSLAPSLAPSSIDRRPSNDSGSQYSTQFGRRNSYANGEESNDDDTDLTREEVLSWTPTKVAQYLERAGVESSHCEVFQEEEFSGEVLLSLDQSAILLQELKLGSIGRRMKTWAKIRALQEDVKAAQTSRKPPGSSTSNTAARGGAISRQASPPSAISPTNTSVVDNIVNKIQSQSSPRIDSAVQPGLPSPGAPSPSFAQQAHRPSAASIRGLAHSRQSSIDREREPLSRGHVSPPLHGKQASLDRAWTMDPAMGTKLPAPDRSWTVPAKPLQASQPPRSATSSRPSSTVHLQTMSEDRGFERPGTNLTGKGMDAFSSDTERDPPRQRDILMKTESMDSGRIYAPTAERKRASTLFWKGSRDSSPEKKSELTANSRVVSEPSASMISPTVTKLAYDTELPRAAQSSISQSPIAESPVAEPSPGGVMDLRKGLRTISDAISGREKTLAQVPIEKVNPSDVSMAETSTLGGSSTPSIDSKPSDFVDANTSDLSTPIGAPNPNAARRKPKKATSAYTRGLLKLSPSEQRNGCEYSGWMKKKSSSLVGTWKPRLFVLRGRRLSYYYSENDTEEQGLIDISNHRVLPVENEFITGIASFTGAISSNMPSQPSNFSRSGTVGSMMSESPGYNLGQQQPLFKGDAQTFIFKLVPPRTGLSKGVNFTKPTIHYFAVSSLAEGRMWMAALMKATIDRDETRAVITTYQQKTISLEKARARKERPPELKEAGQSNPGIPGDDEEDTVGGALENDNTGNGVTPTSFTSNDNGSLGSSQRPSMDGQQYLESRYPAVRSQSPPPAMERSASEVREARNRSKFSFTESPDDYNGQMNPPDQGLGIRGMEGRGDATALAAREAGTW